jgi:hypothetical protein
MGEHVSAYRTITALYRHSSSSVLPNCMIYVFRKIMGFKGLFGGFLITRRFPDCTIPLLEDEVITRVLPCTVQAENIGIILRDN